jgi:hypothetical protein
MDGEGDGDRETPQTSSDDLLVVATSSTGLMGEFLNEIRTEIELNSQNLTASYSSSDSEEIEFWYLPRFDTASELRAVSTRYFGQSERELVTAVMVDESMESLDEPPPSTSYRVVHSTATEPPTSDEEQETLVVSIAMDEATDTDSVVVDPVPEPPEPARKKRKSWLSAMGRAVLDFGRKMCCCGRRRRRRSSE